METIPQKECVEAGCGRGVQRCSQPRIDCDCEPASTFALLAGITTKKQLLTPNY